MSGRSSGYYDFRQRTSPPPQPRPGHVHHHPLRSAAPCSNRHRSVGDADLWITAEQPVSLRRLSPVHYHPHPRTLPPPRLGAGHVHHHPLKPVVRNTCSYPVADDIWRWTSGAPPDLEPPEARDQRAGDGRTFSNPRPTSASPSGGGWECTRRVHRAPLQSGSPQAEAAPKLCPPSFLRAVPRTVLRAAGFPHLRLSPAPGPSRVSVAIRDVPSLVSPERAHQTADLRNLPLERADRRGGSAGVKGWVFAVLAMLGPGTALRVALRGSAPCLTAALDPAWRRLCDHVCGSRPRGRLRTAFRTHRPEGCRLRCRRPGALRAPVLWQRKARGTLRFSPYGYAAFRPLRLSPGGVGLRPTKPVPAPPLASLRSERGRTRPQAPLRGARGPLGSVDTYRSHRTMAASVTTAR
jgi:hypothetical protein